MQIEVFAVYGYTEECMSPLRCKSDKFTFVFVCISTEHKSIGSQQS